MVSVVHAPPSFFVAHAPLLKFIDSPLASDLFYLLISFAKISSCQRHGLAVSRADYRFYMTGSIHGWSRSHLTYSIYRVAADSKSASSLHSLPQLLLNFSLF